MGAGSRFIFSIAPNKDLTYNVSHFYAEKRHVLQNLWCILDLVKILFVDAKRIWRVGPTTFVATGMLGGCLDLQHVVPVPVIPMQAKINFSIKEIIINIIALPMAQ